MVLAQVPPGVMVFGNSPGDTNDLQSLEPLSGVCGVKGGDADPAAEVIVLSFLSLLCLMWGLEGGEGLALRPDPDTVCGPSLLEKPLLKPGSLRQVAPESPPGGFGEAEARGAGQRYTGLELVPDQGIWAGCRWGRGGGRGVGGGLRDSRPLGGSGGCACAGLT